MPNTDKTNYIKALIKMFNNKEETRKEVVTSYDNNTLIELLTP